MQLLFQAVAYKIKKKLCEKKLNLCPIKVPVRQQPIAVKYGKTHPHSQIALEIIHLPCGTEGGGGGGGGGILGEGPFVGLELDLWPRFPPD